MKLYQVLKCLLPLTLLLSVFCTQAWADYRLPPNTDGDAIADEIERWLVDQGITKDDANVDIAIGTDNTYNDSDNDSIPDILETNLTHTVIGEDDSISKSCPGEGTFSYSGQRALRIFNQSSQGDGPDLTLQYLSHLSFCHLGSNQLSVYNPFLGYNDVNASSFTADPVLANTYVLDVVWTQNGNKAVELKSSIAANPLPVFTTTINGTIDIYNSQGGVLSYAFGSSGHTSTLRLDSISGVIGFQTNLTTGSGPTALSFNDPRSPGTRMAYLAVNPGGTAAATSVVFYVENDGLYPGVYLPSVGALFIVSSQLNPDSSHTQVAIRSIFMRDRNGSDGNANGSDLRGEIAVVRGNGSTQFENFYARSGEDAGKGAPAMVALTIIRPTRTFTRLSLMNVPYIANQITLSGPNNFSHVLVDTNDASNNYATRLRLRNLVPGFVMNPAVGVNGSDGSRGSMNVSQLFYQAAENDATQQLPNGTYSATTTVSGFVEETKTFSVDYTAPTQNFAVVNNLTFNNLTWDAGTSISNVGVDRDQTINFAHADVAASDLYLLKLHRTDGINLNEFNATHLFITSTTTSITIPQASLDAGGSYCARVQARNSTDHALRSETDLLCFNTVAGTNPGDSPTPPATPSSSGGGGGGGGSIYWLWLLLIPLVPTTRMLFKP